MFVARAIPCRGRIVNVGFMLHLAPMLEPLTWLDSEIYKQNSPLKWEVVLLNASQVFSIFPWIWNNGFFLVCELLPEDEFGPWLTLARLEAWWSGRSCMEFNCTGLPMTIQHMDGKPKTLSRRWWACMIFVGVTLSRQHFNHVLGHSGDEWLNRIKLNSVVALQISAFVTPLLFKDFETSNFWLQNSCKKMRPRNVANFRGCMIRWDGS